MDLGEDLHITNSPCAQSDERSGHDQLDVGRPLALSVGPADELCNSNNTTGTNSSSGRAAPRAESGVVRVDKLALLSALLSERFSRPSTPSVVEITEGERS